MHFYWQKLVQINLYFIHLCLIYPSRWSIKENTKYSQKIEPLNFFIYNYMNKKTQFAILGTSVDQLLVQATFKQQSGTLHYKAPLQGSLNKSLELPGHEPGSSLEGSLAVQPLPLCSYLSHVACIIVMYIVLSYLTSICTAQYHRTCNHSPNLEQYLEQTVAIPIPISNTLHHNTWYRSVLVSVARI